MRSLEKIKIIATNKKANFQYNLLTRYEAGLVLLGTEVKSCRMGKVNLQDSYAKFFKNELFLMNSHISEYKFGNLNNHNPIRERKLLLKSRELRKIKAQLQEKGLTMVPVKLYFKDSLIKAEMAIAQGKKLYDKRETIKKRETDRNLNRIK